MIFGNSSRFAVEFNLDKYYNGVWLYGKFCFWIYNNCIGNYDSGTSLRDILIQSAWIMQDHGNRKNSYLFSLTTKELYKRLNIGLYGTEESQYKQQALDEMWARFNIKIPGDVFEDWILYLIDDEIKTRIIIGYGNKLNEYILLPKEFDNVFICAWQKLFDLYDIENKKLNLK